MSERQRVDDLRVGQRGEGLGDLPGWERGLVGLWMDGGATRLGAYDPVGVEPMGALEGLGRLGGSETELSIGAARVVAEREKERLPGDDVGAAGAEAEERCGCGHLFFRKVVDWTCE